MLFYYYTARERFIMLIISDSDFNKEYSDVHRLSRDPADLGEATRLLDSFSRAITTVVDAVMPSVVSITVTTGGRYPHQGAGSGVIIAPDGYILTNSHVVHGAGRIEVVFADGHRMDAGVIGEDPATDLAAIHVPSSGLPFSALGNAGDLRVGQLVIAVGNPMGFDSTVSQGIVSSLGRALRSQDGRLIENVIQHTAPLNPGNSGGPLVNSRGLVVGINTAIIAMAQGIGFAIPAGTAEFVLSQLLAYGRVRRGYLGISGRQRPLPRQVVNHFKLQSSFGVEVVAVEPGAPASGAGIRQGDIIVTIDRMSVSSVDDLHRFLTEWPTRREIPCSVIRGSEMIQIRVTPAEADTEPGS
jgi:S1-C subfamily serine protease